MSQEALTKAIADIRDSLRRGEFASAEWQTEPKDESGETKEWDDSRV